MQTRVSEIEVRGKKYEVFFDDRTGKFSAVLDDERIDSTNIESLKTIMTRATKKTFAIDVWIWVDAKHKSWPREEEIPAHLAHAVITGKHASTGNLLVRMDGEKSSSQVTRWGKDHEYLRLEPEEKDVYTNLQLQLAAASKALADFEDAHKIDTATLFED